MSFIASYLHIYIAAPIRRIDAFCDILMKGRMWPIPHPPNATVFQWLSTVQFGDVHHHTCEDSVRNHDPMIRNSVSRRVFIGLIERADGTDGKFVQMRAL